MEHIELNVEIKGFDIGVQVVGRPEIDLRYDFTKVENPNTKLIKNSYNFVIKIS